jgi:spore maturation protein CgeB
LKIAFLTSIYPKHLEIIYEKHKRLEYESYEKQNGILKKETLCSMGEWSNYFESSGIPTLMVCRNNIFIQNRWCIENQYCPKSDDIEFEVVAEQVLRFKPTVLFIFGASYYAQNSRLEKILSQCSSIKKKVSWYGAPEGDERKFYCYDIVLTNSIHLRDKLRNLNIESEQVNHAFEPKILEFIEKKEKEKRIGFIGTTNKNVDTHRYRTELLERMSKEVTIDIYTEVEKHSKSTLLKYKILKTRNYISRKSPKIAKSLFPIINYWSVKENLPTDPEIYENSFRRSIKLPIYGINMYETLNKYLISFNGHISHTGEYACNLRLFEASGLGSCLLTDHLQEINSIFEIDYEVVTYKNHEEAIEKAKFLLNNNETTKEIGKAAQKKTLNMYNTNIQAMRVLDYITK